MDKLEDIELAAIVEAREDQAEIEGNIEKFDDSESGRDNIF
jgi:hypothetical protein